MTLLVSPPADDFLYRVSYRMESGWSVAYMIPEGKEHKFIVFDPEGFHPESSYSASSFEAALALLSEAHPILGTAIRSYHE